MKPTVSQSQARCYNRRDSLERIALNQPRTFSGGTRSKNLLYLKAAADPQVHAQRVGFVLLAHFSLAAFTGALDTLVTGNLLRPGQFVMTTFSLAGAEVLSDLGILIKPDAVLDTSGLADLDLLIVCGGLRTSLKPEPTLNRWLQDASRQGIALGGLWNGALHLARSGLLHGYRCAIHPENRAALAEISPDSTVTPASHVIDRDRYTAASPNGAFALMLEMLRSQHGAALAEGIEQILAFEGLRFRRVGASTPARLSVPLRNIIDLMENNLEEPLSLDQLAEYVGLSRRQVDRLFQRQLATSPHRHYMELRITESRRLLQQSSLSIMQVAVACGFVSVSHFSKCYSSYFNYPPSKEARLGD